jgi:hypothetical protein
LAWIDRKNEKEERLHHETNILTSQPSGSIRKIKDNPKKSLKGHDSVKMIEDSVIDEHAKEGAEGGEHINFKEIGKLPCTFWLIIIICMLSEALFIPFLDNGNAYYVDIFGV